MRKTLLLVGMCVFGMSVITLTERWPAVMDSWFIAPTMLLGSMIAGATAEGGGAVAFPVLTLVFDVQPSVARDFSLMIQSVGMSAASLATIAMGLKVEWRAVGFASLAGFVGVLLGVDYISPLLPPAYMKMFFVSFWLAFATVLFVRNRWYNSHVNEHIPNFGPAHAILLTLGGVLGGIVSGITGCGLDITTFSLIVLGFGVNEAVATRSSVIMMAAASVFGFAYKGLIIGMDPAAWDYWFVALPVVIVGAPLGAWFIRNKSRQFIARILYVSIIVQFITAILVIQQSVILLTFTVMVLLAGLLVFSGLAQYGRLITGRHATPTVTMSVSRLPFRCGNRKRSRVCSLVSVYLRCLFRGNIDQSTADSRCWQSSGSCTPSPFGPP
jgi:uncharacterized membrane protein YfcA